jgi:tRNA-splicing ligase RtcB (3'-phosphate/5'-hydroxy nucleic acid ligase)
VQPIALAQIRPERLDAHRWRLPRTGPMQTDGLVYADEALFAAVRGDPALVQVCNVAALPGIVGASVAMPDIHWGYGFPIGGVAAFDAQDGVISPGGVGFDISCGVRLLRCDVDAGELVSSGRLSALVDALFERVPSGVGRGAERRLTRSDLDGVLRRGAAWAVEHGLGRSADLEYLEDRGCMPGADPAAVSERARERGAGQLGTLGSGNHFLEIQRVDAVLDAELGAALGLREGAVVVSIHTGSRGLGYQVCEDHVKTMVGAAARHRIALPDRQLCCAPIGSAEARAYLGAMACAANYARANRQAITHAVREAFAAVLGGAAGQRIGVVYDVCHNLAKLERHRFAGEERAVWVHRKGATRALPPGHPELPAAYRAIGQPVLVPGDMGRYSFVLCGAAAQDEQAFHSSCHGAGRVWSRSEAKRRARGRDLWAEMRERGVLVRSEGRATIAEEMPEAYKDVAQVVQSVVGAGLARYVARLRPMGVVKG